jgi:hypothetical protein
LTEKNSESREWRDSSWWPRAVWVLWSLVALLMLGGVVRYLFERPWALIAVVALPVVLYGTVLLWLRYAWMQRLATAADRAFGRFVVGAVLTVGSVWIARGTAELVAGAPLVLGVAVLLAWLALLLVVMRGVSTEARRKRLWNRLHPAGRAVPYLYAVVLAFVAIIFFATLASVLADHHVIEFGAPVAEPADALDFFAWHLLDAIPGLDVTKTLRWDEPLGYSDSGVGLLVLAFKIAVIAPIVAAFAAFWGYGREGRRPTNVQARPAG